MPLGQTGKVRTPRPMVDKQAEQAQVDAMNKSQMNARVRSAKLKEDIDGLLAEVDSVLEDNAEEFVRNYVQKGGE